MPHEIDLLCESWKAAKEAERQATEERRIIEDRIAALLELPETFDGVQTLLYPGMVVKITGRLDRKVDSDKAQEIAAEHGLQSHLSTLFRWKPEIDMKAWRSASPELTQVFSQAITVKPGRPSFSITTKD